MLDTHLLAWLASDRARLAELERRAIEAYADDLVVSVISLWELRLKWRSNPRKAAVDGLIGPDAALRFLDHRKIDVAPFTAADVAVVLEPPLDHKDPFDEILLVHAQRLGARLLTRDRALLDHPLAYQP